MNYALQDKHDRILYIELGFDLKIKTLLLIVYDLPAISLTNRSMR